MPTSEVTSPSDQTSTLTCPLCHAPLNPEHPDACTKCDWVSKKQTMAHPHRGTFRDRAAVALSVVPGLGHIYKGYRGTGIIYMIGAVFAFMACFVAATFTAGFALGLLPIYWVGIMLQVYFLEDKGITPAPRRPT